MMLVAEHIPDVRDAVRRAKARGQTIGFVPTMGALHAGHLSLIEASRRECDATAVSIFVNPTQFGPQEDFQRYPRPREADLRLCERAGADLVFYPAAEEMYPPGATTFVEVRGLSDVWEGAIRPGHFRGVATVVMKLLHIVPCDRAYFGQKDYQQQLILRRMVQDLNLPVEIVTCPIVRDADGLALSSRNAYLSPSERQAGLSLPQALRDVEEAFAQGERHPRRLQARLRDRITRTPGIVLDYAVVADPETLAELESPLPRMVALVAGRVGATRLIDNTVLTSPG
jgi:pantoate--beta-alanine ligase